jgi:hypothetical protein
LCGLLRLLALEFGNPQVEPFDFLEGEKVDFPEQFDDLGLVGIHSRIMAAVVVEAMGGRPGVCGSVLGAPVLRGVLGKTVAGPKHSIPPKLTLKTHFHSPTASSRAKNFGMKWNENGFQEVCK